MVSYKISKSCGIISRIRNTLDIKSKKNIYYRLIHPYLTYCINDWSSIPIENPMYSSKEVSAYTLCCCSAAPFERYLHQSKQKFWPQDKLINRQEGILAYKVIKVNFLNHGDVRHKIQLINLER